MSVSLKKGFILGDQVGVQIQRPRTFVPRRVCLMHNCNTLLSIYNPRPHCAVHEF